MFFVYLMCDVVFNRIYFIFFFLCFKHQIFEIFPDNRFISRYFYNFHMIDIFKFFFLVLFFLF